MRRCRVHDHGNAGIRQFQFACQCRFRHRRHADDMATITRHAGELGAGFVAWPLGNGIGSRWTDSDIQRLRQLPQLLPQTRRKRLTKIDMTDLGPGENAVLAAPAVIDELIGQQQLSGLQGRINGANGEERDNLGHVDRLQRRQIAAVIDGMRRELMVFAMARQAPKLMPLVAQQRQCSGRLAVRGRGLLLLHHRPLTERLWSGSGDDCPLSHRARLALLHTRHFITVTRFGYCGAYGSRCRYSRDAIMSITALSLTGFIVWTLALLLLMEIIRTKLVLTKAVAANAFRPDNSNLSPFMQRLARAHANCLEGLPIFGGLMLVAMLTEQSAITDPLAPVLLVARMGQSLIHLVSVSAAAVTLRFTAFVVQLLIACFWSYRLLLG